MPVAKPPMPVSLPAPLSVAEERYVLAAIRKYYGDDAVVRNWGPQPDRLMLHVETDQDIGLLRHECLGLLMCALVRDQIDLIATKRGERIRGSAKIAYRQGIIISGDPT
jgi:hypothetical protein